MRTRARLGWIASSAATTTLRERPPASSTDPRGGAAFAERRPRRPSFRTTTTTTTTRFSSLSLSLSPSRWDDFASDYEARVEPVTSSFVEAMLDPFSPVSPDDDGGGRPSKLLDVGCGTGALALFANGRGFDVTAIDVDPSMVSKLVERDADRSIDCVVRDGQSLPSEYTDSFEYVASSFSVPFFPDPHKGLREMRRCLVPGTGRCVVSTWGDRSESPAFRIVPDAVRAVAPDLIGPSRDETKKETNRFVGSTTELVRAMEGSGYVELEIVGPVTRTLVLPSPRAYYERFALRSPPTLAMISWMEENMERGTAEKFESKVKELAAERGGGGSSRRTDGEVAIVSPAYFVHGTKPPP